jgi:hypothetical protein
MGNLCEGSNSKNKDKPVQNNNEQLGEGIK